MRPNWVNLLFAVTIFLGAFLLFQVQPLIGKFILPWFGGSYGVWTTCLLFFQVMLLAGYLYAHGTVQYLPARVQMVVHLMLLAAAVAMLPITPSEKWIPQESSNPSPKILALLFACVGIPYLALASTGPLLQAWFARIRPGQSPYRLYALSNVASMLALLSYPFVVEPNMTRMTQAGMWSISLVVFALCCAVLTVVVVRPPVPAIVEPTGPAASPRSHRSKKQKRRDLKSHPPQKSAPLLVEPVGISQINWKIIAAWLLLPTLASAMLLAITNKICQDVAAVPLLWVLPLAIYLLTFIICFDSPRWYLRKPFIGLMALMVVIVCWLMSPSHDRLGLLIETSAFGALLFSSCMVYHGELVRLRPVPSRLTLYYAMIAGGGALGGFLVAIVAPLVFKDFYEFDLSLLIALAVTLVLLSAGSAKPSILRRIAMVGLGAISIAALVLAPLIDQTSTLFRTRNFYGVLTVYDVDLKVPHFEARRLQHGNVAHGIQFMEPPEFRRVPTSYYGAASGVGLALLNAPRRSGKGIRVGIIGLGAGTLAVYAREGDEYKFYEINPEVEHIARTYFTGISDAVAAGATVNVVLGDARMSLQRETEPENFDVLVLDAFNGDAVPVHLLTRECFEIYLRHLRRPGGVIAVHISNQYLDLSPIAKLLAEHFHLHMADIVNVADNQSLVTAARWILMTDDEAFLNIPAILDATGESTDVFPSVRLWTDNDTSLFPILRTNLPRF